jgi:hypothetical protein
MKSRVRRHYLIPTIVIFFILFHSLSFAAEKIQPTGPYDSIRDYITAIEARGRLLRIKEVGAFLLVLFYFKISSRNGDILCSPPVFEHVRRFIVDT